MAAPSAPSVSAMGSGGPASASTHPREPGPQAPAPASAAAQTPAGPNPAAASAQNGNAAAAGPQAPGQPQYRPLNVRDALSYLDEVKAVFHSEPEVYNRFLDIMKEFKTQNIDTPGVIDRVSALFRGNPALIQGFNTFLPPGYHIDFYPSSSDQNGYIYVTTPSGTTRSQANYGTNLTGLNGPQSGTEAVAGIGHAPPAPEPVVADYSRAIAFLDRLKERLAASPDVFTVTLEVFRFYDRDTRSISTITDILGNLLRPAGAGDLLDDFRIFTVDTPQGGLPAHKTPGYALLGSAATTYNPGPAQPAPQQQRVRNQMYAQDPSRRYQQPPMQPQPMQAQQPVHAPPAQPTTKKRRVASNAGQPAPTAAAMPGANTARFLNQSAQHFAAPLVQMHDPVPPKPKRTKVVQAPAQQPVGVDVHGQPMVAYPPPTAPRALVTAEEKAFFERVAGWMDDRHAHHEFLKTLNLYTNDAISLAELVERVHLFIHNSPELWKAFTDIVGWREGMHDDGKLRVEANGEIMIENVPIRGEESQPATTETYGPSYHKLAVKSTATCSGRDPLCYDVLNDEWVSRAPPAQRRKIRSTRPTKNAFEVALNQSEESRYEHDFWIEANLRTIALLEPINSRILIMSEEERASFRLRSGLGGSSKAVYQGVIKAVYGAAAGVEVLNHLHEHPVNAVPIVLNRLRAKDEEWKKSLRDWNRVWREADALNHPRALNHQAALAASADRSLLASQPLVVELEALRMAQLMRDGRTAPQLKLSFSLDDAVIFDMLKLTLSYLDRSKTYSDALKTRIEASLRLFVSAYFSITPEAIDEALTVPEPVLPDQTEPDDSDASTIPLSVNGGPSAMPRKRTGDLRKKAIRNSSLLDAHERPVPATAAGLEGMEGVETVVTGVEAVTTTQPDIEMAMVSEPEPIEPIVAPKPSLDQDIFCHSQHYVLLRLLHTFQSRLGKVKTASTTAAYSRFLELCEELFSESITLDVYQSSISQVLGNPTASSVYTLAKLIVAVLRASAISIEASSLERHRQILQFVEQERAVNRPATATTRQAYRAAIEALVGGPEDHVYHLIWSPATRHYSIQLLTRMDPTPETVDERDERWLNYIASYSSDQSSTIKAPLLRRTLPSSTPGSVSRRDGLRMRIDRETYKLGYIAGSEEVIARTGLQKAVEQDHSARLARFGRWHEAAMERIRKLRSPTPEPPAPAPAEEAMAVDGEEPTTTAEEVKPIEPSGSAQQTATAAAESEATAAAESEAAAATVKMDDSAAIPAATTEADAVAPAA